MLVLLAAGGANGMLPQARAQDIEPRAYSNAPIGVNFLIVGHTFTEGDLSGNPSLPIEDPQFKVSSAILAYSRVVDFGGRSGKIDAILPYAWLSGSAEQAGETIEREVDGPADARFRVSVNLHGAPALTMEEFARYRQELIVGASLQVSAPTGQYDANRLINIGTNRWSFRPEVGISKAHGPWTQEFIAGVNVYTDNDDFFGGNTRSQEPIWSLQGLTIYSFGSGIWASVGATWFTGGRTTVAGRRNDDLQQNWRLGAALSLPVDARNSVKLQLSSGVSARTGNDYDFAGLFWQYRWGGGL